MGTATAFVVASDLKLPPCSATVSGCLDFVVINIFSLSLNKATNIWKN
jgi:hypothetical protein